MNAWNTFWIGLFTMWSVYIITEAWKAVNGA